MLEFRRSILIKAVNTRMKRQARDWAGGSVLRTSDKGLSTTEYMTPMKQEEVTASQNVHILYSRGTNTNKLVKIISPHWRRGDAGEKHEAVHSPRMTNMKYLHFLCLFFSGPFGI